MTAGRKSLLTPELQQQIVNTLSVGNTIADTCAYVGIGRSTYDSWITRGERGWKNDEPYVEFLEAVTRARVQARIGAVAILRNAVLNGQDTEVARWFLERSDPLSWGRVDTLKILGLDAGQMKQLIEALTKANIAPGELFEQLIQQAAALDVSSTTGE